MGVKNPGQLTSDLPLEANQMKVKERSMAGSSPTLGYCDGYDGLCIICPGPLMGGC